MTEAACAKPPSAPRPSERKMKMKTKKKSGGVLLEILRAVIAAIMGGACAYFTGCTTINFPSDETRPASFNGITSMQVGK